MEFAFTVELSAVRYAFTVLAEVFDQPVWAYFQRSCEGNDGEQCRVCTSSFEHARIVSVQVGQFRQFLLR